MHIVCPHCQKTNRVPEQRLAEDPSCGHCGQLLLDGRPVALDDKRFDRFVSRTDLPVVVDFWAPWCGPCRAMAPQFEQAAQAMKGRALFVKVNSDDSPAAASRFAIRSIPTLVLLRGGKEAARRSGAVPAAELTRWVQAQASLAP